MHGWWPPAKLNKGREGIKMEIPKSIITAVETLLIPYKVDFQNLLHQKSHKTTTDERRFLSVADAVRYSGCGRWTLFLAAKSGKLKTSKLSPAKSGKLLYDKRSLDDWLESCHVSKR